MLKHLKKQPLNILVILKNSVNHKTSERWVGIILIKSSPKLLCLQWKASSDGAK